MFVNKKEAKTIRFANGTICSGSEKNNPPNYVDYAAEPGRGCQFEGYLKDILTVAADRERGIKAHWKLILESTAGRFGAKLNMSTNQAFDFFNSLASIEDFSEPLRINVWQGTAYNPTSKPPTIVHLLKSWNSRKDFYRWKYPYLKDGETPNPNTVYFPRAKQKKDEDGELMFDNNGYAQRNYKPVNKFIEENIVAMIRAKLQGLSEEVPGDDYLEETQDDLPETVSNLPANEIKQNVRVNQLAGSTLPPSGDPGPNPPAEEEGDKLPF